jgi:hypothetical protein
MTFRGRTYKSKEISEDFELLSYWSALLEGPPSAGGNTLWVRIRGLPCILSKKRTTKTLKSWDLSPNAPLGTILAAAAKTETEETNRSPERSRVVLRKREPPRFAKMTLCFPVTVLPSSCGATTHRSGLPRQPRFVRASVLR